MNRTDGSSELETRDQSVIPSMADKVANQANIDAIDRLVETDKYHHIVAWGKFLGFTPLTVNRYIQRAQAENAPGDAIQKLDGKWVTVSDITNESNRKAVDDLAKKERSSRH